MTKQTLRNINHWFFFVFVISLLPILINLFLKIENFNTTEISNNYFQFISQGQILLISIVLLGKSIGELIKDDTDFTLLRNFLIGLSVILLIVFIFSYTNVDTFSEQKNKDTSLIAFVGMFIVTFSVSVFPKKQ
ncbi:hypothetical protein [Aquimarina rhabdastrellae]